MVSSDQINPQNQFIFDPIEPGTTEPNHGHQHESIKAEAATVLPETEFATRDSGDTPWDEPRSLGQTPAHTPTHPRKISEQTRITYEGHLRSLRSKFLLANPHVEEPSPVELVEFLINRYDRLRPKTVLIYRSALLFCFRALRANDPEVEQACLMLQYGLPKHGYRGNKPGQSISLYSSKSLHKRTFPRRDFERLLRFLGARGTDAADEMIDWLLSGLATGLRPAEWEFARWADTQRTHLRVKTLKRHLDKPTIPGLSEETLEQFPKVEYRLVPVHDSARETVDAHLRNIAAHLHAGDPFSRIYEARRRFLRRACVDCFGPNGPVFTLYMMRGQFSANAKKVASAAEVAQLMGCMPKRVMGNYGSKKAAHRSSAEFKPGQQESLTQTQGVASESLGANTSGAVSPAVP